MKKLSIALVLVLSSCAALQQAHQTALDVRKDTAEVADKLQQTLDFEKTVYGPARSLALGVCKTTDPEGPMCVAIITSLDKVDQAAARAQTGVDTYRKDGTDFDGALKDVQDLVDDVGHLKNMVDALEKSEAL